MKKIICIIICFVILACLFGGCNRQIIDTTYRFDEAYIYGVDGSLLAHGHVNSWNDYENSDSVQVKIDGVTYYTHLANVVLIAH